MAAAVAQVIAAAATVLPSPVQTELQAHIHKLRAYVADAAAVADAAVADPSNSTDSIATAAGDSGANAASANMEAGLKSEAGAAVVLDTTAADGDNDDDAAGAGAGELNTSATTGDGAAAGLAAGAGAGSDGKPMSWLKRHNIKKLSGPKVRVATFNVENLVLRYKFRSGLASCSATFTRNDTAYSVHDLDQKKLTAAVIHDCNADVLALMEVENLTTIDYFNKAFLQPLGYRYSALIEAHDPRFINVAVLSRFPILAVRSHKDDLDALGNYLLTRSCLEVDIDIHGTPFVLYANHFRSMRGSDDGRKESARRREEQAAKVREIVAARWECVGFNGNFIVCGDLNDKNDSSSSITALTRHPSLENIVERLPKHLQWTHHFNGDDTYSQLDYMLVARTLAQLPTNIAAKPVIVRAGLPYRASKYRGPRHKVR